MLAPVLLEATLFPPSSSSTPVRAAHVADLPGAIGVAARAALVGRGFDFASPPEVDVSPSDVEAALGVLPDLRALPWSSVDDASSRDLDQVELAEPLADGGIRLRIGIADVDARVPIDGAVDRHAQRNGTSVYAGSLVFGMLPEALSAGATSLLEGEDRIALVITLDVGPDGRVRGGDLSRGVVCNHAKLAYGDVGAWLAGGTLAPSLAAALDRVPWLAEQLRLQDEAATRLRAARRAAGGLEFETREARAVARPEQGGDAGAPPRVALEIVARDRARDLIEAFMVAANVVVAEWLARRARAGIVRVVREPARWGRVVALAATHGATLPPAPDARALAAFLEQRRAADPEAYAELSLAVVKLLGPGEYVASRPGATDDPAVVGHFGLAVDRYAHATAPNRRYADLVTLRVVKAALADAPPPYTDDALADLAHHCTEREGAARAVERVVRKSVAALLLAARIGERFDGVVTGIKRTGTYVRLLAPPAEGRIVEGEAGLDVGDHVRLRLLATDAARGFLDFARER